MKKVFIFSICSICNDPVSMVEPCKELGYNAFPQTNFHGGLSIADSEELRNKLIDLLKEEGRIDDADYIEKNTKVMEVTFNNK